MLHKFNVQFLTNVRAFKAARLCFRTETRCSFPRRVKRNFPFLDDATIANLATELPLYLAAADDVMCDSLRGKTCVVGSTSGTLPHWVALVRKLSLIQPSSASAERVFSVLNTLSAQQEGAPEDYIEASVMIRYNNNQRKL